MTQRNAAGRPIWFAAARDGGGVYRPVTLEGRVAFVLAALWIVVCGAVFPVILVLSQDGRWLLAMFVVGAAGLAAFAAAVVRHS